MAAEQGTSSGISGKTGYYELIARYHEDKEEFLDSDYEFLESEELFMSDEDIRGDVDSSDTDEDVLNNNSTNFDPNYKPVWGGTAPKFGVERLHFSGTPGG